MADKQSANDHSKKHEPKRRKHADRFSDQHETGDLRQYEGDDDHGNGNSHDVVLAYGTGVAERKAFRAALLDLAGKVLTLQPDPVPLRRGA